MGVNTRREKGKFYTRVDGLQGGLDTNTPPQAVPLGRWVTADNFRFRDGYAELVPGWESIGGTGLTGVPMLVDQYKPTTTLAHHLMLRTSTGTYYLSGGGAWTDISGLGANYRVWAAQMGDWWYTGGYDETAYKWNWALGSMSSVAAIPEGQVAAVWANRLWVGYVPGNFDTLYYSNLGDAETWDAADIITSFEEAPGEITAIAPISASELAVHKAMGLWRVQWVGGSLPFKTQYIPNTRGAQWGNWLTQGANGVQFFLANDNVYLWDGTAPPMPIGDDIFDTLMASIAANSGSETKPWTWYDPAARTFLVAYRDVSDTTSDSYQCTHAHEFDPRTGAWGHRDFQGRTACQLWQVYGGSIGQRYASILAGENTGTSHVSILNHAYALGGTVQIPGLLKSGATDFGIAFRAKRIEAVRLFTDSETPTAGSITAQVNAGDDPGNLDAGTAQTLVQTSGSDRVVEPNVAGRYLQLQINATCRGKAFRFNGFEIEWKPTGRTG